MDEVIIKLPLNRILFALLGKQQLVYEWWHIPNRAFDNKTPDTVYQSGAQGRKQVADYLYSQLNGDYS